MKLTKNFSLEEFTKSQTAEKYKIDNSPNTKIIENISNVAKMLQVIRDYWKEPIIINSGYRCESLNKKVGGAKTSLHMDGLAVDFTAKDKKRNKDLFNLVVYLQKKKLISVRSIIWEKGGKEYPTWIHIDINGEGHQYRNGLIIYYY